MSEKSYSCIIEISQDSDPVKYELDKKDFRLKVDRIIPVSMRYPGNYGFILNTQGGDGDPLDIIIISSYPIISGAKIEAKPIGVIKMQDEGGMDEKIIAVPAGKIDPQYSSINELSDLSSFILDKIMHFFERYKDLEKGKWIKIEGIGNRKEALDLIEKSMIESDSSMMDSANNQI